MERKKLELQLNVPVVIELLYDQPQIGESSFGKYYLYSVRNGDGATNYSYFSPPEVHEQLKNLKRGTKVELTKLAEQKGSKILTRYNIKVLRDDKLSDENDNLPSTDKTSSTPDTYFNAMLASYQEALKIQEKFNGLIDVNRVAITLYISKTKIGSNGLSGA